jgi:hypothetical protein
VQEVKAVDILDTVHQRRDQRNALHRYGRRATARSDYLARNLLVNAVSSRQPG